MNFNASLHTPHSGAAAEVSRDRSRATVRRVSSPMYSQHDPLLNGTLFVVCVCVLQVNRRHWPSHQSSMPWLRSSLAAWVFNYTIYLLNTYSRLQDPQPCHLYMGDHNFIKFPFTLWMNSLYISRYCSFCRGIYQTSQTPTFPTRYLIRKL